nr:MAG TPA: Lower collar protein [Caudoviricetes sp.]
MSKYTTELRYICETEAGLSESTGQNKIKDVIAKAIPKIFDFDFPIFDESYRNVLEAKILKHYYTREIGLETYGLWKLKLDTKLNEIMPFYNQLYKSALLEFNPLYEVDYSKTGNRDSSGTRDNTENNSESYDESIDYNESHDESTTNSNDGTLTKGTTTTTTNYYSDTPQGAISNVIDGTYLTNATYNVVGNTGSDSTTNNGSVDSDSSSKSKNEKDGSRKGSKTSNSNLTDTESYLESVRGKMSSKSYSALLMEYRETFINIDMMLIEELSDLFFGLW